jgi:hypothetical protein
MPKKIALAILLAVALAHPARAQRFMFTGVTDAELLTFFGKFQKAVVANDRKTVASMVNYPLRVNDRAGHRQQIATSAELMRQYDAVFTPAIRQAIATEKASKLTSSRDGAGIAAGLVYMTGTCDKRKPPKCVLGVVSVNHM